MDNEHFEVSQKPHLFMIQSIRGHGWIFYELNTNLSTYNLSGLHGIKCGMDCEKYNKLEEPHEMNCRHKPKDSELKISKYVFIKPKCPLF